MTLLETIPDIISLARRSGLESVADRLDYLYRLDKDDGDESMNLDTVKILVSFLIDHPEVATATISTNPNGFVHISWRWTQYDILHVQFFPAGNVWFSYFAKDSDSEQFKMCKTGDMSPNNMLKIIMPLVKQPA